MSAGKPTTIKDAIKRWEDETHSEAATAIEVNLSFQWPPIEKMDSSLAVLTLCEKLSLSTNMIEKMSVCISIAESTRSLREIKTAFERTHLRKIDKSVYNGIGSLKRLRILSLSRNAIKSFVGLETLGDTLEELWISYNAIEKMKSVNALRNLKVLYMSNNLVKEWNEFMRLQDMPNLQDLLFAGNPITEGLETEHWRLEVSRRLPSLEKLDGEPLVHMSVEELAMQQQQAQTTPKSPDAQAVQ